MKSVWYLHSEYGLKIFRNVGEEYFKVHGVYPTVDDQMPEFLSSLGYPCESDTTLVFGTIAGEDRMIEAKGLKMEDEVATALILRFGV